MKRAIFLDLDSTTTHRTNKYNTTQDNINMIKTAQKQDVEVIVSTGRSLKDAMPVIKQIKIEGKMKYIVTSNGSFITKDFKEEGNERSITIKYELAKKVAKFAQERKALVKPSYDKDFYGSSRWTMKLVGFVFKLKGHRWRKGVVKFDETKPLGKLSMVVGNKKTVKKLMRELNEEFGSKLQVTTSGGGFYIETNPGGVSKGTAAEYLADKLGFNLADSAHFGDSSNDIELLKRVGYPFAVANASKKVKTHAKFITESDKNSGVAKGIKNLLHNEWK